MCTNTVCELKPIKCLELICGASTYVKGCPWSLFVSYRKKDKVLIKTCSKPLYGVNSTSLRNPEIVREDQGKFMLVWRLDDKQKKQTLDLCHKNMERTVHCTEKLRSPLPPKVKQQEVVTEQQSSLLPSLCESEKLSAGGKRKKSNYALTNLKQRFLFTSRWAKLF